MIAIIDYGMGNLRSVQKAFEAVGHQAVVTRDHAVIANASHLVLPGVGAFGDCMTNLDRYGLIDPIKQNIAQGKPFLGICLGLQLLFTESHEFGVHKGLDILPGSVKRFPDAAKPNSRMKVPHMGWNTVDVQRPAPPLAGIERGTQVYFVHSYYVEPRDRSVVTTTTDYGVSFASSVWRDNVFACQFHPEKSQAVGLRIMRNFGEWR
jgi:imidazole glycerol-phosphate synthase subunit HisH